MAIEVVPHNATVKTCILESLNQDIVQVDDYGILQERKAGVAKIKICSPDEKIVCYTTVVVGKDTPVPSINPRTTEEPTPSRTQVRNRYFLRHVRHPFLRLQKSQI